MITRQEFVKICMNGIYKAREKVTPINQKSGYIKFHKEIKENKYFEKIRKIMDEYASQNGYSLFAQHKLISYGGVGHCHEFAEYLATLIISKLKKINVDANIEIVKSSEKDHLYLRIKIVLEDEKKFSVWEVDAWDPRVIDVSLKPNGKIKNLKELYYGDKPITRYSTKVSEYDNKGIESFKFRLHRPSLGQPERDATPERDVCKKHKGEMYKDYSLERATKKRRINPEGEIHYLQKRSKWQR